VKASLTSILYFFFSTYSDNHYCFVWCVDEAVSLNFLLNMSLSETLKMA